VEILKARGERTINLGTGSDDGWFRSNAAYAAGPIQTFHDTKSIMHMTVRSSWISLGLQGIRRVPFLFREESADRRRTTPFLFYFCCASPKDEQADVRCHWLSRLCVI